MDINFNGKKVMLVVNGLIIASLVLITNDFNNLNKDNNGNYIYYNETVDANTKDNIDVIDVNTNIKDVLKNEIESNDRGYIISNFVKMKNKNGRITYIDLNNYIFVDHMLQSNTLVAKSS